MLATDFQIVFEKQWKRSHETLLTKSVEYATDSDLLVNFKTASALLHTTPEQALTGMLAKHVVSIFDMVGTQQTYSSLQWDEKITDAVNYLILLRALLIESGQMPIA